MQVSSADICKLHIEIEFAFNRKTTPEYERKGKGAPFHNLLYIYEGCGTFHNGEKTRRVQKGDLVFFPRGGVQHMKTDPENLLQFYTVNFFAFLPVQKEGKWHFHEVDFPFQFVKHLTDDAIIHQFIMQFDRVAMLYLAGADWKKAKQREAFSKILEFADLCHNSSLISLANRKNINRTVYYMAEHFNEKITLETLSDLAGLSPSRYSYVFRSVTGRSPIDYLINLRLFKAKQLIMDGMTIGEAADRTGFSDTYYFSRLFKKHNGDTPSTYLKKNLF